MALRVRPALIPRVNVHPFAYADPRDAHIGLQPTELGHVLEVSDEAEPGMSRAESAIRAPCLSEHARCGRLPWR